MRPYTKKAAKYYDFLLPGEFKNAKKEALFMAGLWGKRAKSVLDAGCGTGRLAIPLAEMGYDVTGLDITPAMIETAKQKRGSERIRFVVGDMCSFRGEFDVVICGSNTMTHFLTDKKAVGCLKNFRRNLAAGGALVFDVFDCGRWEDYFEVKKTVKKKGVTVRFVEKNWVDRKRHIYKWVHEAKISDHGKGEELVFGGRLRYRDEAKWRALLKKAGFKRSEAKRVKDKIYFVAKA